ncbi:MAG: hypothetical protein RJB56_801 [Actinomycetota bacterium]|jgi:hypothetical protein
MDRGHRSYCYERAREHRVKAPPGFLWLKLDSIRFFYHPDFNRRCWNFTSSTAEPLTLVAQTSLANQMAGSSGRGL